MTRGVQPPSTSSSLLVQLRDAGDVEAWRTFADLYTPLVYRFARRRGLQDADAQDVVQRVFTLVSQAIRKYDPLRGRFRGWLGAITSQTIDRHVKASARPGQAPGQGADEPLIDDLQGHAEPAWVDAFNDHVCNAAMERIREEFDPLVWRAFELTWVENQDSKQVAAAMQKGVAWVYKAKFKVLQRLKQEVEFLAADEWYFA